ncbi:hypothetical protein ATK17_2153 [Branchiibius hedensis]|uniref:Uncharacterized protein n=1 Tax=Branchiibius hedensis TaxID=672460 RepID=A0A2Y9C1R9_9MICO|nr:hypothetical protein ATK17_2153 [Branchiibius hedensis]SSA34823.1 hypothetical protein SAMN04489750_2153 [Branchiibius hedensis]
MGIPESTTKSEAEVVGGAQRSRRPDAEVRGVGSKRAVTLFNTWGTPIAGRSAYPTFVCDT